MPRIIPLSQEDALNTDFYKVYKSYSLSFGLPSEAELSCRDGSVFKVTHDNITNETIMAYFYGFEFPTLFTDSPIFYLDFVFVQKPYRRMGLLKEVLEYLCNDYKVMLRVMRENQKMYAFCQERMEVYAESGAFTIFVTQDH